MAEVPEGESQVDMNGDDRAPSPDEDQSKSSSEEASSVIQAVKQCSVSTDTREDKSTTKPRPESLVLCETPLDEERRLFRSKSFHGTDDLKHPLSNHGSVTTEGELVNFVADDLAQKIKLSSSPMLPQTGDNYGFVGTPGSVSSGWSMSSASGWSGVPSAISRSPSVLTQSPEEIPPTDPRALYELELAARSVADDVDQLTHFLKLNMHKMSVIVKGCVEAYSSGVFNTCSSVDANIKTMYALMAKGEELSKAMQPVYETAEKIEEIKRLLQRFEACISDDG